MTNVATGASQAKAARIAGAMYLIGMATAIFAEAFVRGSLIVSGDATRTAQNIFGSELLYRIGIATDLFTFTTVVVLTWALYVLLRPVNKELVVLAVLFRGANRAVSRCASVSVYQGSARNGGGAKLLRALSTSMTIVSSTQRKRCRAGAQ
jgi:hypothetical protein